MEQRQSFQQIMLKQVDIHNARKEKKENKKESRHKLYTFHKN